MLAMLRPACTLLVLFTLLTGIAYPLAMTGLAQVLMPAAANGSLIARDGRVVGSLLVGQAFSDARYFHARPSATSATDPNDETKTVDAPYNGAGSSGSNLGPLSRKLIDRVAADVERLRGTGDGAVPGDAVTTSASGLDPHISPAYALLQVERVAKARQVPIDRVQRIIMDVSERPFLGIIGEPRVNVLLLNLALDRSTGPATDQVR